MFVNVKKIKISYYVIYINLTAFNDNIDHQNYEIHSVQKIS